MTPFGQVPTLEIDGKVYSQTLPICRYLAKQYNLLGKTDLDALEIDAIANALHDFRKRNKLYYIHNYFSDDFYMTNVYNKILEVALFFRETDTVLQAKIKERVLSTVVPLYLKKLEELVSKNDGYLYDGKVNLHFYNIITKSNLYDINENTKMYELFS